MQNGPTKTPSDPDHELAEVRRVISEVTRRRIGGESVDDDAVQRRYSHLMPNLGERLRVLRGIETAESKARLRNRKSGSFDVEVLGDRETYEYLSEHLKGYELFERLSYGGQGVVFRAQQRDSKREVAIKLLLDGPLASERKRHRFAREIDMIARLNHPGIVTLYESGVVGRRHYFAMEFVDGVPIDDFMLLERPSVREIAAIFIEICRAINYAHQRGIIHRDLKPTNILVDDDRRPHILDFGLGKELDDREPDSDVSALSLPGQIVGTMPYLSPEQLGGEDGETDVRSDVYALGVVVFQTLTGNFPYPVEGKLETVRQTILTREPLRLRQAIATTEQNGHLSKADFDDEMEAIVRTALQKEKDRRYQSAAALADDLERYLAGDAVEARADSRLYVLKKVVRKYRVHVGIAAGFAAMLAASSVLVTAQWLKARHERDNARAIAQLAHSTLDAVVNEFEEAVRPLAGGAAVRDRLMAAMDQKYEQLRPLVESDVALEGLLAAIREKQGDIACAQGRRAEAGRHYEALLQISRRRIREEPSDIAAELSVARAHRKLGEVAGVDYDHFETAIDLGTKLASEKPAASEERYELCIAHLAFGQRLLDDGRYEWADEQAETALGLAESELKADGGLERWLEALSTANALHGRASLKLGRAEAGLASLQKCLHLREELTRLRPSDVNLRHELFLAYANVAKHYRDRELNDQAIDLFRKSVEEGSYLTTADPGMVVWKHDLYGVLDPLTRLCLTCGALDDAQLHCDAAVSLAEELVDRDPVNPRWRRTLAFSHYLQAMVSLSRERIQEAYSSFHTAAIIRGELRFEASAGPALHLELATTHDRLAECAALLEHSATAIGHHAEACRLKRQLSAENPDVTEFSLELVESQLGFAALLLNRGWSADGISATELVSKASSSLQALEASGRLSGDGFDAWPAELQRRLRVLRNALASSVADSIQASP